MFIFFNAALYGPSFQASLPPGCMYADSAPGSLFVISLFVKVVSIGDLSFEQARHALALMRMNRRKSQADQETLGRVVSLVGGRMSFLSKMSRAEDLLKSAQEVADWEKAWLLSQIGLIPDCDDDVMDEVWPSSIVAMLFGDER